MKVVFIVLTVGALAAWAGVDDRGAFAVAAAVSGDVKYKAAEGGTWDALKKHARLGRGAEIETATNGNATILIEAANSAVRLAGASKLIVQSVAAVTNEAELGAMVDLDLRSGEMSGHVAKMTEGSRYEIETPHGVVGVGNYPKGYVDTDFEIKVEGSGPSLRVTFMCFAGRLIFSSGCCPVITQILNAGDSFNTGDWKVSHFDTNAAVR